MRLRVGSMVVAALCLAAGSPMLAGAGPQEARRDPEAVEIARSVMQAMGGEEAWESTRIVSWNFFGNRRLIWDKWTGDVRIHVPEGERDGERTPETLYLMNIDSRRGRVWVDGEEITDEPRLGSLLQDGYETWVNDSYWMFMPYKLLDPGVNLAHAGEEPMQDGRPADVLELTFEGVGVTPRNKYRVWVARDSGLVEQWAYYADRDDEEPGFVLPWADWRRFGDILLATDHGRGRDWDIHVYEELPPEAFTDPSWSMQ